MPTAPTEFPPTHSAPPSALRWQIVHAVRGRIRLRVEPSRVFTDCADSFAEILRALPGVQEVRCNPGCRSVTLTYDAASADATTLLARMRQLSLAQLQNRPIHPPRTFTSDTGLFSWLPVGLSTTALTLGVLGGASIAPWLLAGAALPLFSRAYDALIRKVKLNGDVLDASATALLFLNGQLPATALIVWLIAVGDFIHDRAKQQVQETLTRHSGEASDVNNEKEPEWLAAKPRFHETRLQQEAEQIAERSVPWSLAAASVALMTGSEDTAAVFLAANYDTTMRVAVPMAVLAAMNRAAAQGVVFGTGDALERMAAVDALVFDKTGVLTQGTPDVIDVVPYGRKISPERVLALAAAAERDLAHPLAGAILQASQARGLTVPEREAIEFRPGLGVEAVVEGAVVLVGSQRFMQQKRVPLQRARKNLQELDHRPASPLFVAVDGKLIGFLALVDPLRPEMPAVVESLRAQGVREMVLVTGDYAAVAAALAEQGGISRCLTGVFPEERAEFVRSLQQEGRTVAVVTSGRSPSLASMHADIRIICGSGAEYPHTTDRAVFLDGDLRQIPRTFELAREGVTITQQNRNLVFSSHTIAVALSLLGALEPVAAILLSKGSTVLATGNALMSFRRLPDQSRVQVYS